MRSATIRPAVLERYKGTEYNFLLESLHETVEKWKEIHYYKGKSSFGYGMTEKETQNDT